MTRLLAILAVYLACISPAAAGAWLREKGAGFMAAGVVVRDMDPYPGYETKIYTEYGLRKWLTIGFDINENTAPRGSVGHAVAFLRLPILGGDSQTRVSFELGAGVHHIDLFRDRMAKATLAVGRGFSSPWGHGWFDLQAAYEDRKGIELPVYKFDGTIGLSADRTWNPLLAFESYYIEDEEVRWTLTPAVSLKTKRGGTWILGLERKRAFEDTLGFRLELWRNF